MFIVIVELWHCSLSFLSFATDTCYRVDSEKLFFSRFKPFFSLFFQVCVFFFIFFISVISTLVADLIWSCEKEVGAGGGMGVGMRMGMGMRMGRGKGGVAGRGGERRGYSYSESLGLGG